DPWVGRLFAQEWNPPCLIAGEVVVDDAAGRQDERVVVVGLLGGRDVNDRMETGFAVGKAEALLVKPRRAGMLLGWAGPEDTILRLNLLIGDPPVVRFGPLGAQAQFIEDRARRAKSEVLALA